jgi:acyl carrier protein
MLSTLDIQAIILKALANVNSERSINDQFLVDLNTRIFGENSVLDSFSLVSVIVDIETEISEKSGYEISLTDDKAMAQEISPFTDVNSLTTYIQLLLNKA